MKSSRRETRRKEIWEEKENIKNSKNSKRPKESRAIGYGIPTV